MTEPKNKKSEIEDLYFIRHSDGQVKVGVSKNPTDRINRIQHHCVYDLELEWVFETDHAADLEKHIHRMWEEYNVRGEWFDVPPDEYKKVANRLRNADPEDGPKEVGVYTEIENENNSGMNRIHITLTDGVLEALDEYVEENMVFNSRSSVVNYGMANFLPNIDSEPEY